MFDFEVFKGIGAPLHQSHHPQGVFIATPLTLEFPKMNTIWQTQQSTHLAFHPILQIKRKGPGQRGRGRRLKVVVMTVVVAYPAAHHFQVLEKGQGTDKCEDL
jgi:hypothetical protein